VGLYVCEGKFITELNTKASPAGMCLWGQTHLGITMKLYTDRGVYRTRH